MKLDKKKFLASKVLGIGKDRVGFNVQRLNDIKEAITKQDIRDLVADGAIFIKEIKGSKVYVRSRRRRGPGSIRKLAINKKRVYMILTRKLRSYIAELQKHSQINDAQYITLRKEIRAHAFKSKAHMKERLKHLK